MINPDASKITPRDEGVLRLLARGCSNKEIAGNLHISPRTVKQHLRTGESGPNGFGRRALARWDIVRGAPAGRQEATGLGQGASVGVANCCTGIAVVETGQR
jgi:DNA-binding CsgD family transcriptional regulator